MSELIEYICDELCRYPEEVIDQEELDVMCANCRVLDLLDDEIKEAYCNGILVGAQVRGNDVASVGPVEEEE